MIIGIDLGTSYCTASFVNSERIPTLVGDAKTPGQFRTPSLLALSDQCCCVGRRAEELGLKVERLARLSYGPIRLGELPVGKWRALTPAEEKAIHRAIK